MERFLRFLDLQSQAFAQVILQAPDEEEELLPPRSVPRSVARSGHVLEFVSLAVPRRLRDEDVGDAIELISRLWEEGAPPWKIYAKTLSTLFWIALNAVREISGSLFGRQRAPNEDKR